MQIETGSHVFFDPQTATVIVISTSRVQPLVAILEIAQDLSDKLGANGVKVCNSFAEYREWQDKQFDTTRV